MDSKNIVTKIDGFGSVEAKNDLATFSLTIRSKDASLETAKRQTQEKTSQAINELDKLNLNFHEKVVQNISNFKLEHRESGEKYSAGFSSVNTITFTIFVDEKLNEVYKLCSKIDPHMHGPYFNIKDREVLTERALNKAAENAKEKLHNQCWLLGVSEEKLRIFNWTFSNAGPYGLTGATGPQGAQGSPGVYGVTGISGLMNNSMNAYLTPLAQKVGSIYEEPLDVKLEPGNAYATVSVSISYVWAE